MERKWRPFHVGLKPQPMHNSFIWCQAVTQDFCWFPKSRPTRVVVMAWWWIHMPINSIWRLSNTFHMYGEEAETISCGFEASITEQQLHLAPSSDQAFLLISRIRTNKCGGIGMMTDPYAHQQHMNVVKHLSYVWRGSGNHLLWVWSLNHWTMPSFGPKQWPGISANFPNPDQKVWW